MQNSFKKWVEKIFCHTNFTNLCSIHFATAFLHPTGDGSAGLSSCVGESWKILKTNDTYLKNSMFLPSTWEDFMVIGQLLLYFFYIWKIKLLGGRIRPYRPCWVNRFFIRLGQIVRFWPGSGIGSRITCKFESRSRITCKLGSGYDETNLFGSDTLLYITNCASRLQQCFLRASQR